MKVEVDVVLGLGSRTERGFSGGCIKFLSVEYVKLKTFNMSLLNMAASHL